MVAVLIMKGESDNGHLVSASVHSLSVVRVDADEGRAIHGPYIVDLWSK